MCGAGVVNIQNAKAYFPSSTLLLISYLLHFEMTDEDDLSANMALGEQAYAHYISLHVTLKWAVQ